MEETRAVQASLDGHKIFVSGHSPIIQMMEEAGHLASPLRPVFERAEPVKRSVVPEESFESAPVAVPKSTHAKDKKNMKLFSSTDPRWKRYHTLSERKHPHKRLFPHGDARATRLTHVADKLSK